MLGTTFTWYLQMVCKWFGLLSCFQLFWYFGSCCKTYAIICYCFSTKNSKNNEIISKNYKKLYLYIFFLCCFCFVLVACYCVCNLYFKIQFLVLYNFPISFLHCTTLLSYATPKSSTTCPSLTLHTYFLHHTPLYFCASLHLIHHTAVNLIYNS